MNTSLQRGVGSVEITAKILSAMIEGTTAKPLKDIAKASGLSPARLHPYLVSLIKTGFIEQDSQTSHYDLGPMALRLGTASLQKIDPIRIAIPFARTLSRSIGHTVALAVWSNSQATVIHLEEALTPIRLSLRHGSVMSLTQTATGLMFAAHLPPDQLEAALQFDAQISVATQPLPVGFIEPTVTPPESLKTSLKGIQARGIACVRNTAIEGVGAISCPVFNHTAQMVLAITTIGLSATLDTRQESACALAIKQTAHEISQQLGFSKPPERSLSKAT